MTDCIHFTSFDAVKPPFMTQPFLLGFHKFCLPQINFFPHNNIFFNLRLPVFIY